MWHEALYPGGLKLSALSTYALKNKRGWTFIPGLPEWSTHCNRLDGSSRVTMVICLWPSISLLHGSPLLLISRFVEYSVLTMMPSWYLIPICQLTGRSHQILFTCLLPVPEILTITPLHHLWPVTLKQHATNNTASQACLLLLWPVASLLSNPQVECYSKWFIRPADLLEMLWFLIAWGSKEDIPVQPQGPVAYFFVCPFYDQT